MLSTSHLLYRVPTYWVGVGTNCVGANNPPKKPNDFTPYSTIHEQLWVSPPKFQTLITPMFLGTMVATVSS